MSTKEKVLIELKGGKLCPKCGSTEVVGRVHVINKNERGKVIEQKKIEYKHCKMCHYEWY